jgi:spore coat polysaccharide biosynthesis predicted glycosyltransferase SpsG
MNLKDVKNQNILFACNDWGMGHLMRSIPIINQLIKKENEILFAGTIFQIEVLKEYIPTVQTILYQGSPFKFKGDGRWNKEMLRNTRNLLLGIKDDKTFVQKIIKEKKITLTISDHRYGFRNKTIHSIFITHQINLPVKGIENIANQWHTNQLKRFNSIWVLDNENHSFAGKLSTPTSKLPIHYLGIQSRFEKRVLPKKDFILAVISGPEPYAEQLFIEVIEIAKKSNETFKCISQKNYNTKTLPKNLEIVNQLTWIEKDTLYYQCKSIISRTGYTTIMDLAVLQKPALLIPTPGQKEQEYLYLLHKQHQKT